MSTAALYYGISGLRLTSEGAAPVGHIAGDLCCPDPLCVPLCDTICSFIDLLPSGPMWDFAKLEARQIIQQTAPNCEGPFEPECLSMVWYGVYGGLVLNEMTRTILWPAIREANPATAVTTIDDWLERFGWEDCYRTHCRTLASFGLSPFERPGDCGPIYCEPTFSDEFNCALKHAILMSLSRARRGVIKTLDGINWVLEPLRASVRPKIPYPQEVLDYLQSNCDADGYPCFCDEVEFEICQTSEWLPGCPPLDACQKRSPDVAMAQNYQCEQGDPVIVVYPAVLAAECIARSLLKKQCPNILYRCGT